MKLVYFLAILSCISCQTISEWTEPEFLSNFPSVVSSVQGNKENIQILQERLDHLERIVNSDIGDSLDTLRTDIQSIKNPPANDKTKKESKVKTKNKVISVYDRADQHFKNKEWKQAILIYEEFRKKNPKSEKIKTATFNIGLSFKNLELTKEASIFFREVVELFPGSDEAQAAAEYLIK